MTDINRYAFDDVPGDLAPPAIIEPGRARVGVDGKVLDVFKSRDVL